MTSRQAIAGYRALIVLGCTDVSRHGIGKDHHLSATAPTGEQLFLSSLEDLEAMIIHLARVRARS